MSKKWFILQEYRECAGDCVHWLWATHVKIPYRSRKAALAACRRLIETNGTQGLYVAQLTDRIVLHPTSEPIK